MATVAHGGARVSGAAAAAAAAAEGGVEVAREAQQVGRDRRAETLPCAGPGRGRGAAQSAAPAAPAPWSDGACKERPSAVLCRQPAPCPKQAVPDNGPEALALLRAWPRRRGRP
ncbi:hypothetical protein BDY21DRAFT_363743 [Lineolata rhizophorae]|uniref:Uncharacterized protein n=1 Tax=Lineolata rhizophorae TaxID=578093 RepID=A0A6A6P131_9PEZI|nr:hypothetical protein BDY21DRAFT_363743 [Lineolata rhizophorae]